MSLCVCVCMSPRTEISVGALFHVFLEPLGLLFQPARQGADLRSCIQLLLHPKVSPTRYSAGRRETKSLLWEAPSWTEGIFLVLMKPSTPQVNDGLSYKSGQFLVSALLQGLFAASPPRKLGVSMGNEEW